jgi:15-cis-phytoene synthase
MTDAAFQSYLDQWLASDPQQRVALGFLEPGLRNGHVALAAFEREIVGAAYGISEAHVAAVKLNWWAEELSGARASGGRHPLTRVLFNQPQADVLALELWIAPVLAAMGQLEEGTAADFQAQVAATSILHGALARLETAWWFGASADPARAIAVATQAHLLASLALVDEQSDAGRLALPMACMARFSLTRAGLRTDNTARRAALKAQAGDIAAALRHAAAPGAPLSLFRAMTLRQARRRAEQAVRAADPLAVLKQPAAVGGPSTALFAWRVARGLRRPPNSP